MRTGRRATDAQVKELRKGLHQGASLGRAAMKAGMGQCPISGRGETLDDAVSRCAFPQLVGNIEWHDTLREKPRARCEDSLRMNAASAPRTRQFRQLSASGSARESKPGDKQGHAPPLASPEHAGAITMAFP